MTTAIFLGVYFVGCVSGALLVALLIMARAE